MNWGFRGKKNQSSGEITGEQWALKVLLLLPAPSTRPHCPAQLGTSVKPFLHIQLHKWDPYLRVTELNGFTGDIQQRTGKKIFSLEGETSPVLHQKASRLALSFSSIQFSEECGKEKSSKHLNTNLAQPCSQQLVKSDIIKEWCKAFYRLEYNFTAINSNQHIKQTPLSRLSYSKSATPLKRKGLSWQNQVRQKALTYWIQKAEIGSWALNYCLIFSKSNCWESKDKKMEECLLLHLFKS